MWEYFSDNMAENESGKPAAKKAKKMGVFLRFMRRQERKQIKMPHGHGVRMAFC